MWVIYLGDAEGAGILIKFCAIDLNEIHEPWLHLAAARGNLFTIS